MSEPKENLTQEPESEPEEALFDVREYQRPQWVNQNAYYLTVKEFTPDPLQLHLKSSAAELTLKAIDNPFPNSEYPIVIQLQYGITQCKSPNVHGTIGTLYMQGVAMLECMFGCKEHYNEESYQQFINTWEKYSDRFIKYYGGGVYCKNSRSANPDHLYCNDHFAYQKYFIRIGPFLNIPHPGTGRDGDSNLSIELRPETVKTVEKFIQAFVKLPGGNYIYPDKAKDDAEHARMLKVAEESMAKFEKKYGPRKT